ncbi:MAG: hypothetical protein LBS10_10870 [Gracilibacteraceae bacterium]|nr:hypothetical protein [Gracilibacteraceae bacterium]
METRLRSRRPRRLRREEIDPAEGVANLADLMLVFICGLMLSIIMYYHVSFGEPASGADSGLVESGYVYVDPETGKAYAVMPADNK